MTTILEQYFPALEMGRICRVCRGVSDYRCKACKMAKKDYEKAGLQREVEEFKFLHLTWLKCKMYKQVTTGISKLDFLLTMLFGVPHDRYWRDYSKTKQKMEHSKFVVLRTVEREMA